MSHAWLWLLLCKRSLGFRTPVCVAVMDLADVRHVDVCVTDVADDPMEVGVKRGLPEEDNVTQGDGTECNGNAIVGNKRCSSENENRKGSWNPDAIRLQEISSEVM